MSRSFITQVTGAIESFLAEFTAGRGIFPVEIQVRGQKDNLVVEVFVDGDAGIDTAACAEINRALSKELDEGILADASWSLTVSSPGIDRPLAFPRQYPKHAGRGIALVLRSGGATERLRGTLVEAGAETIRIRPAAEGDEREVRYADIVEAKIEPRW